MDTTNIILLISNAIITIISVYGNIKSSKLNNYDKYIQYHKKISYFELNFKDENWFNITIKDSTLFWSYDMLSRNRIKKVYNKRFSEGVK